MTFGSILHIVNFAAEYNILYRIRMADATTLLAQVLASANQISLHIAYGIAFGKEYQK